MALGPVGQKICDKLEAALEPASLEVIDESHLHAGHAGFRVKVVSKAFEGKPLVQRHRMINEILAEELKERVHALAISAKPA
jgi:BolA protein